MMVAAMEQWRRGRRGVETMRNCSVSEIEKYIMKAREMYNATGTVPAVRVFAKEFGMDRKAKELYEVFESGPMKKIAKYGGLPKPTGCV